MLCRLNHELLPDPGSPIASTTVPLLARAAAAATSAGNFPATTASGTDASATDAPAATAGVGVAAAVLERDPPRPPRPRRRRGIRGLDTPAADDAAAADTDA